MLLLFGLPEKKRKKKCDIPAGKAKQKQAVSFFLFANFLHTLNIKMQTDSVSQSRRIYHI